MTRVPNLSKTRFQAGLQCHKRLWLECHARELADPIDEARQAIFDQGHRVGEAARELYPGGVLVAEDYTQTYAARQTTTRLINEGASCLYEPALMYDGVLVRVDVLRKVAADAWQLVEVKSSGQLKPEHLTDAAIQTYVARGAGIPVSQVRLLHLDAADFMGGGAEVTEYHFVEEDLTAQVEEYLPRIPALLAEMKTMLVDACPAVTVGEQCRSPYDCGFIGHCHAAAEAAPGA
jgi:hypothetical protein